MVQVNNIQQSNSAYEIDVNFTDEQLMNYSQVTAENIKRINQEEEKEAKEVNSSNSHIESGSSSQTSEVSTSSQSSSVSSSNNEQVVNTTSSQSNQNVNNTSNNSQAKSSPAITDAQKKQIERSKAHISKTEERIKTIYGNKSNANNKTRPNNKKDLINSDPSFILSRFRSGDPELFKLLSDPALGPVLMAKIQDAAAAESRLHTLLSNLQKSKDDTLKSIVNNIR